jgi:hypothetical protein
MPTVLYSFRKTPDGIMFHGFMAANPAKAEKMENAHAAICPQFGPALAAEQTIEIEVDVDDLPEFDEASLEDFLELDDEEEEEPEEEAEEEAASE